MFRQHLAALYAGYVRSLLDIILSLFWCDRHNLWRSIHAGSWWWLSMTGNVQTTLCCTLCGICWLSFLYVFLILFWCDRPNLWRSIGSPSSRSTWDPDDGCQWLEVFDQHLVALLGPVEELPLAMQLERCVWHLLPVHIQICGYIL